MSSASQPQIDTEVDPVTGVITKTFTEAQAEGTSIITRTSTGDGTVTFDEESFIVHDFETGGSRSFYDASGQSIQTWVGSSDPAGGVETDGVVGSVATADGFSTFYQFAWTRKRDGSSIFEREYDRNEGWTDRFTDNRSVDGSNVTTSVRRRPNHGMVKVVRTLDRLGDGVQQVRRYDSTDTELSGEQFQVVNGKTVGESVPLPPEEPEPEPEGEPDPERIPVSTPEPGPGPEPEPNPGPAAG